MGRIHKALDKDVGLGMLGDEARCLFRIRHHHAAMTRILAHPHKSSREKKKNETLRAKELLLIGARRVAQILGPLVLLLRIHKSARDKGKREGGDQLHFGGERSAGKMVDQLMRPHVARQHLLCLLRLVIRIAPRPQHLQKTQQTPPFKNNARQRTFFLFTSHLPMWSCHGCTC